MPNILKAIYQAWQKYRREQERRKLAQQANAPYEEKSIASLNAL